MSKICTGNQAETGRITDGPKHNFQGLYFKESERFNFHGFFQVLEENQPANPLPDYKIINVNYYIKEELSGQLVRPWHSFVRVFIKGDAASIGDIPYGKQIQVFTDPFFGAVFSSVMMEYDKIK